MAMPIYSWSLGNFIQLKHFLLIQHPGKHGALLIILQSSVNTVTYINALMYHDTLFKSPPTHYLMRAFCLMSRKIHAYTNMSYC